MGIYQPDDPSDTGDITNYTINTMPTLSTIKTLSIDIGSSFFKPFILSRNNEPLKNQEG